MLLPRPPPEGLPVLLGQFGLFVSTLNELMLFSCRLSRMHPTAPLSRLRGEPPMSMFGQNEAWALALKNPPKEGLCLLDAARSGSGQALPSGL